MPNTFPETITEISNALRALMFSTEELVRHYISRIEKSDMNAYLDVHEQQALEDARAHDQMFGEGNADMPLDGIPLAVKDNILIAGRRATAGSKILENYIASYHATVVKRLIGSGAIFLGKTNMDEFAMGSSTENSAFGPTKNPHDQQRVPGGSSGGSAAAVAAGLAAGALGSDTGGSIRQPASFCGVVGFKPSYGAVSRSGLIAMASSLDQIGPITRSVADARTIFHAIRGQDPLDSTTVKSIVNNQQSTIRNSIRVGVPKEYFGKGLDPEVAAVIRRAIKQCESAGVEVREVSLPHTEYALATYYIVMPAEVSANLARFDGIRYGHSSREAKNLLEVYEKSRAEGFGPESKRRIMLGTFTLSHGYYDAYYLKAQRVRRLIRNDFETIFAEVDFIVGPTAPTPAFRLGEKTSDPLEMYLADIYTVAVNLAGVPAISIPAGSVERDGRTLPVGFQIIGKWFQDDAVLDFAERIEALIGKTSLPDV